MANELTLNASLAYAKNAATVQESIVNLQVSVTGNGLNSLTAYSAPTTSTAIPLGSSTTPRWLFVLNTDPTNYVTLQTAASGTAMARLQPGEFCLLPLDAGITAPALQAHTAACICKFAVFDN